MGEVYTFYRWWESPENQQDFWRTTHAAYGVDRVAVSLGETPRKIFRQILQLLKEEYHDKNIGYGNLLQGVRIGGNKQVHLDPPNPNIPLAKPFASIKKDILDFEGLVTWAEDLISLEPMQRVQPPYSSTKFHDLFRLLDNNYYYKSIDDLRRFGFFVRNNPLFMDETDKYLFFKKVLTIKEYDVGTFRGIVKLTDVKRWSRGVRHAHLVAVKHHGQNRNRLIYRDPDGSIVFFRNCLGHLRLNNVLYRYHDAKILLALEDDLPKGGGNQWKHECWRQSLMNQGKCNLDGCWSNNFCVCVMLATFMCVVIY